ncbi:hypothetical protein BIV57_10630 [Mangrovactinospora gilvigrisea]|uniref:Integral membrane protein n=1 Tax=Mangrovactinospora gilvigrisea TaxID=1428644 RepID=A0A1J7BG10_9ACTN|nr:hypothetical protein [Mangrovactinospora gilvigrisea]OIV37517.1 hypothetical protein BIV57_10630 [Mangrovactinospora gilvigrisea]
MAQPVARNQHHVLNTDGRAHPRENALAVVTALAGLLAIVTSLWPHLHVVSCWAGLVGLGTGAVSQMISETRGERFVNVIGMGAAAVGLGLGIAHGGVL